MCFLFSKSQLNLSLPLICFQELERKIFISLYISAQYIRILSKIKLISVVVKWLLAATFDTLSYISLGRCIIKSICYKFRVYIHIHAKYLSMHWHQVKELTVDWGFDTSCRRCSCSNTNRNFTGCWWLNYISIFCILIYKPVVIIHLGIP